MYYHGLFVSCLGWWVFVLNCYVLGGEFEQLAAINFFLEYLGDPEKGLWGVQDPPGLAGY